MNITLKPEEEQLIQEKLKSGKYQTAYEIIVEALRLLAERDNYYQKWVEETRQKVVVGLEQLDRGEGIDGDVVIARLRNKLSKARENQH
ncbi:MAG TPA: type II toxin-antitoxin system ParD family antitoxin [Cyanobacteria bacterium UBA12227]|nr:type II toxin-antitoxin system ParD family antitoxin [Cyanobacteria bacterium UBA12227]HAX90365.1 type II toxin-antitoxin system ParD family antitoxin [Cyanobacteria bacterium UBA11370]HBY76539.1 type II toxin-antitoxin system ParD family antitoxin [Cyanobacteria bacterium UBA11148]